MMSERSSAARDVASDDDLSGLDDVGESDSFLCAAARISGVSRVVRAVVRAGDWIAGRYELVACLGSGSYGVVWEAQDRVSGDVVALKLLGPGDSEAAARVCREVASLRVLRIPSVVRLIDEGVEGDFPFVVMERAQGKPFPGVDVPVHWSRLERSAVRFCEALGRVHALGLLHRDLKAANVLVDESGWPTILDFGLSYFSSTAAERLTGPGAVVGTPAFIAPELIEEKPASPQTDLYAVGVMLFHALTGRFPHSGGTILELLRNKRKLPAPPLASLVGDVPEVWSRVVDQLLQMDPQARPRSALEVAEALGGQGSGALRSSQWALLDRGRLADEVSLRSLFAGPDRLLHLREDAARLLWARTGGDWQRMTREIEAWIGAGRCRWHGDLLSVDREALEWLDAPEQLSLALAQRDAEPVALAEMALTRASQLAVGGRLELALVHLEEALRVLRSMRVVPGALYGALLSLWAEIAVTDGSPRQLDRALYELYRPGPAAEVVAPLMRLLRAALAVHAWTERARGLAERLLPFSDWRLERLRFGVRLLAARRTSLVHEEAVLEEARAWAERSEDPAARAWYALWLGRLRYCQGRFEEAARSSDEAAEGAVWRSIAIVARLDAASAWMECFGLPEAWSRAAQGLALAESIRAPMLEARAAWLLRCIDYRAGRLDGEGADEALVEAVKHLGSAHLEGLVAVGEATVCYRAGDRARAFSLALLAWKSFSGTGHPLGRLLAGALCVATGHGLSAQSTRALVEAARACAVPSVGLQALALLAEGGVCIDVPEEELRVMEASVPEARWGSRLDVLSIAEALARR